METKSFSSVADLSLEQRQAVESMFGHALQAQDAVLMVVIRPGAEPSAQNKARSRARLEHVFQQSDRHGQENGVQADAADAAIDAAVQDVRSRTD